MADATDSKSVEGNLMRVRPSPPADFCKAKIGAIEQSSIGTFEAREKKCEIAV